MMLRVQGLIGNSGDGTVVVEAHEGGGTSGGSGSGGVGSIAGGFSEDDKARIEEGERNSGGNRWPGQETLALLKIRSDMDVAFRDSSFKGPLWEKVSRKMAELGYHRSAKKCKEKFENVFKYHKRTKEGRASKADGKTYRFFDQLEALENHPSFPPPLRSQLPTAATSMEVAMQGNANPPVVSQVTVPSVANTFSVPQNTVTPTINPTNPSLPPSQAATAVATNLKNLPQGTSHPSSYQNMSASFTSNSTSSSTSSDEEPKRRLKRKRKWKDFFERLMKEVIEKQDEMQKNFLETLEKSERERMMREEAWRVQEMARMNREHELLIQERSTAAAKDAALIAFLQKMTEQKNPQNPNAAPQPQMQLQVPENPLPPPPPHQQTPLPVPRLQQMATPPPSAQQPAPKSLDAPRTDNGSGETFIPASSSRWPKAEVEALIRLRTNLDLKYQESCPKAPLWEEISAGMRKLGYNRNAKRCKEKWENINKYFKKVKESNKKRPEASKTCPYFYQLDALYKEKAKTDASFINPGFVMAKPENPMVPIMALPEQQWPFSQDQQQHQQPAEPGMDVDDHESENIDQNHEDEDEDDEDEGNGYELVTNKIPSVVSTVE